MSHVSMTWLTSIPWYPKCYSHNSHVFLWLQSDLQHFCPIDHSLEAGCGNGLPRDSVDLVEGVGFQDPLVGCTNEDLEP